ncbi:MAG: ATP-binding cassette domain-containing protein, partial [Methylococcales bacterium]|nr:ATP-binding cassette domain-containing protein [Methylococcales bacterium]
VIENLALALKLHNKKIDSLISIHKVLDEIQINHLSQQQAKTLSGGELQKVALARAIITNPDVLLMDEPFSYLDHSSEQWLEQFIHSYVKKHNKTLIFSTHNRLQGIAIADDVISLIKGKLVKTPLINLYHGVVKNHLFDTGKIQILLADEQQSYQHVSIDPNEIVLSRELIQSSMRNQFKGKVTGIVDEMGKIRITLLAGEIFQVLITKQALKELDISLADQLWVNFKSNSILAF